MSRSCLSPKTSAGHPVPSIETFLRSTRVLEFRNTDDTELYQSYRQLLTVLAPRAAFVPIRSATADVMTITLGGTSYVLWDETHVFNLSMIAYVLAGNKSEVSHPLGLTIC